MHCNSGSFLIGNVRLQLGPLARGGQTAGLERIHRNPSVQCCLFLKQVPAAERRLIGPVVCRYFNDFEKKRSHRWPCADSGLLYPNGAITGSFESAAGGPLNPTRERWGQLGKWTLQWQQRGREKKKKECKYGGGAPCPPVFIWLLFASWYQDKIAALSASRELREREQQQRRRAFNKFL